MIQDIYPHRFDNQFRANAKMGENDFVLHYHDNTLLLKTIGDEIEIPRKKDFPEINADTETTFLFTLDDVSCFLVWDELSPDEPELMYKDINFFRTALQQEIAWISIAGLHLMNWYAQNRYCGKCGSKIQHKQDERAIECTNCHSVVYPKISPAIIVAIISNDKILLARNARFPLSWYSLIAGYADVGESLEETVKREVREEVGLEVRNIRYYKSQPWPLSGSMMIGFIAEADGDQPIITDNKEITEAAWFRRGELPNHPPALSIAGELIGKFERGEL